MKQVGRREFIDFERQNTFANPNALDHKDVVADLKGRQPVFRFPPASVTRLQISLG